MGLRGLVIEVVLLIIYRFKQVAEHQACVEMTRMLLSFVLFCFVFWWLYFRIYGFVPILKSTLLCQLYGGKDTLFE